MKIYKDKYYKISNKDKINLAIGNFDGMHLGHQKIINSLKQVGINTAILTFDPHPNKFFDPNFKSLMTTLDKEKYLKDKIDLLFVVDFDSQFASLDVIDVIRWLETLNINKIVVGSDFRFASGKKGTIKDLKDYFDVEVIDDVLINGKKVSSTLLKDSLLKGDLDGFSRYSHHNYAIDGIVVPGIQLGRKLGYPTVNLATYDYYLPEFGVYQVVLTINNKTYHGACNVGVKPTVTDKNLATVEVFILDFDEELYENNIKVEFIKKIRDEFRFSSIDELKSQIQKDVLSIRQLINQNK